MNSTSSLAMSDFVVRGIDSEKYRRFRAILVERDETLGEWLSGQMEAVLNQDSKEESDGGFQHERG